MGFATWFGLLIAFAASSESGCRVKAEKPSSNGPQSATTEASASKTGDASDQPNESSGDSGVAMTTLPAALLESIVGCWHLEDRERWTIQRNGTSGAQVFRKLLERGDHAGKADFAKRAALPANISFNAAERTLGFSTAGPSHTLLFVFTVDAGELQGRWATSHAPGSRYEWLAGNVTLRRCADDAGTASGTRPSPASSSL